ncbi:MAG: hypothetical protein WC602_00715 [archaeon]
MMKKRLKLKTVEKALYGWHGGHRTIKHDSNRPATPSGVLVKRKKTVFGTGVEKIWSSTGRRHHYSKTRSHTLFGLLPKEVDISYDYGGRKQIVKKEYDRNPHKRENSRSKRK